MLIVLVITSDVPVTLLVALSVFMTDLFLFGLIYFWGLTMNFLVSIQVVLAVGISVDYSAHIAYAYLTTQVPSTEEYDTPDKVRLYKAKMAIKKMGTSVFHGGFSTFLAIILLSGGKTYIFDIFFRCWFGIILFGLANAFLLLPSLLLIVGPSHTIVQDEPKVTFAGAKVIDSAKFTFDSQVSTNDTPMV